MKKYGIITWPRPNVSQEAIKEVITKDGYLVTESHPGNPNATWNPEHQACIIFVVETNEPLLLHNIIGEVKKHLCIEAKGIEHEESIEKITKMFLKKGKGTSKRN